MSGDKPEEPDVDVVEAEHKEANYQGSKNARIDTTDDGWGKGVFADQPDETGPMNVERAKAEAAAAEAVPELRGLRKTEDEPSAAPRKAAEPNPAVVFVGSALVAAVLVLVIYLALGAVGVV